MVRFDRDGAPNPSYKPTAFIPWWVKYVVIGLVVLFLINILDPFNSVPTGSRGVVTQFGKIIGIENEGLVLLPPWQKLTIFSIRAEQADINNAGGSTSDTQPVATSLTIRYSISPDQVSMVYEKYSHDGNLANYVQTASMEVFKAVTAKYAAPDLITKRAAVSLDIRNALQDKLNVYGANVINIDMRDFQFNPTYMAAIEQKVVQEQLRLAADNKLKTVESEQRQKVAIAEADAGAVKARADGEAYAQLKIATAQADALKVQNAALASNKDVLELKRIDVEMEKARRWKGEFPTNMYGSVPLPFMNVNPAPSH